MIRVAPRVLRLPRASPARLAVAPRLVAAGLALLLAVATFGPQGEVYAADKDPTEAKIRLMAEALRARDAGDLTGAQQALVQLIALAPNDEAARRLRNEIEAQAVAQQAALAQQSIARQAAEERAAVEAVRRSFTDSTSEASRAAGPVGAAAERGVAGAAAASPSGAMSYSTSPASPSAPLMIDVRLPDSDASVAPAPFDTPPTAATADGFAPAPGPTRDATRSASTPPLLSRGSTTASGWLPATAGLTASSAPSGPLAQKLATIVLPEVNFNRTELTDAVAWLSRAAFENDAASAVASSPRGANIALLDPARRNPPVTLSLYGVTLKRALDFMTESVGYGYEVFDDAIVVRPLADTARVEEVRQVEIEAYFVEVPAGALEQAAASWEALRRLAPAGSAASASGSFKSFVGEFDVTALVRTLTQNGSELLAAPAATVLSGQPARLAVMQDLRYPSSYNKAPASGVDATVAQTRFGATTVAIQAAPPQDFATQRIGAELVVTALAAAADRSITLDLHPRYTAFERFLPHEGVKTQVSGGTSIKVTTTFQEPVFSVRELSTRVKIPDGATLVLGGLTREKITEVDRRLPLLGHLPAIGRLFSVKGETREPRDLLIFITARVVDAAPTR